MPLELSPGNWISGWHFPYKIISPSASEQTLRFYIRYIYGIEYVEPSLKFTQRGGKVLSVYIVLCCPACCPTLSYALRRVICGTPCCPVLSYDAVLCCPACTLVVCPSCPALPLSSRLCGSQCALSCGRQTIKPRQAIVGLGLANKVEYMVTKLHVHLCPVRVWSPLFITSGCIESEKRRF